MTDFRERIGGFVGDWEGESLLFLGPDSPGKESRSKATVAFVGGTGFLEVRYDWSEAGKLENGLILFKLSQESSDVDIVWVDSWHMGSKFMLCKGDVLSEDSLTGLGSYQAPPGPDWGWRISLSVVSETILLLRMFNITPEGQECLAVETRYMRV